MGGSACAKFGVVIDLSRVLDKFVFDFRYNAAVQKYGGPKTIAVEIWAKIWYIFPLIKRGQHESDVCGYFMSAAGGDTAGVVSVGACWAWADGTEDIS